VVVVRFLLAIVVAALTGCSARPGDRIARSGQEMVVCGQLLHVGAPVVLWTDPGGYDAYRIERRFSRWEEAGWQATTRALDAAKERAPARYGIRESVLTPEEIERVRGGGWDLPLLQRVVDQFVIHYDACGSSRQCFKVLHDLRNLSVHFLLDLDGTIYQTLDLKERAWHATTSNTRSIGIEIAHIGAYPPRQRGPLDEWYRADTNGQPRIVIPARFGDGGMRTPSFQGRPARRQLITGTLQGRELVQYDYTPEQYAALVKLTAALCRIFPRIKCDYPRDAAGHLVAQKLSDEELDRYEGLLGHLHIQTNKVDPGPAFQWDTVVSGARRWLRGGFRAQAPEIRGSQQLLGSGAAATGAGR
jgi:N-acetyl-anhydromuramyl-L-alanine amidase AmpD